MKPEENFEELVLSISEENMNKFLPGLSREERLKRIKVIYGLEFEVHTEIIYTVNYLKESQIEAFRKAFIDYTG
jgi:hypothetical protein